MRTHQSRVLETWTPSTFTRAIRVDKPADLVFAASQALRVFLGPELSHPMTIASGPARPWLDFTVQRSDSEFKRAFVALAPGDALELGEPRGHFLLERTRPAVMIASGIGITPMRSMLEALADEHASLSGSLLHATIGRLDVPFRDEIDALAGRAGMRVVRKVGPIDAELLRSLAAGLVDPVWYVAGPVDDVKHGRELLESLGVHADSMRLEAFRYPGSLAAPVIPPGFPDWEALYRTQQGDEMPWFYPELDPDVLRAIEQYALRGRALDIGTGPGTQAIALAARGFDATGTDISASAVERARARAAERGVAVRFEVDDVLATREKGPFEVILDRGCFHVLPPERRPEYVQGVASLLAPGGALLLKCFADDQPGTAGPHRFAPDDIRALFGGVLEVRAIERTVYQGTLDQLPRALFCVLVKR